MQRRWGWRSGVCGALSAIAQACALAQVAPPQVAYEPVGLGWSANEVERTGTRQMAALLQRAHAAQALGCRQHCQRLERIFERLLPVARAQTARSSGLPWSLTVVRLADVDAMALPGGQLLVSEHFIDQRALSDEALAFVLAHEMSHSILEHERQALTYARNLLPRQVPRTVQDIYTEMDYNFRLLKSLEPVMQQGELEADELGLLMASAAGFDPEKQLAFLQSEAQDAPQRRALVSTHPAALRRLQALHERLPLAQRMWDASDH